jgi:hypothetical protein
MCQAFPDFCTFGILNTTTSVHVSIVYISHPKYLWNVICLVGYLKAHPLSCLAWWDRLLTRWPPKASSLTFLCVSTWLFSNLYLICNLTWHSFYSWVWILILFVCLCSYQRSTTAISVGMLIYVHHILFDFVFWNMPWRLINASFILQWHLSVTLTLQQHRWVSSWNSRNLLILHLGVVSRHLRQLSLNCHGYMLMCAVRCSFVELVLVGPLCNKGWLCPCEETWYWTGDSRLYRDQFFGYFLWTVYVVHRG